ncbi:hypothetical protein A2318_04150 [Candidatus Uhrbacteria bacterium RIFOXYB2_FULL_45_11]|uniref:Uncharacterized protein n=1 Tax=Candidatus Uhrbacteria bacterium RIFOXYB2_FULL_45_11 TaxID=1802421 RepID=A0A1F7W202_9BACT|nr:MAG: hypothetical protein A2318_04150 [Candidatus Uhrbacteria bacterium RIFOXYB2_FULL_45_11]
MKETSMRTFLLQCVVLMLAQLSAGYLIPVLTFSLFPELPPFAQAIGESLAHILVWCVIGFESLALFSGIFFGKFLLHKYFTEPFVEGLAEGLAQSFCAERTKDPKLAEP